MLAQVGEIEEQLMSARRELARSEEANQKLQRDVKEVRLASLLTDNKPPLHVSVSLAQRVYFDHTRRHIQQFAMVTKPFAYLAAAAVTVHTGVSTL